MAPFESKEFFFFSCPVGDKARYRNREAGKGKSSIRGTTVPRRGVCNHARRSGCKAALAAMHAALTLYDGCCLVCQPSVCEEPLSKTTLSWRYAQETAGSLFCSFFLPLLVWSRSNGVCLDNTVDGPGFLGLRCRDGRLREE